MPKKSPYVNVNPQILRWLRENSGWTQEEISKRLGVSVDLISRWEQGERNPTFNQIKEMARAYRRPSAAFFLQKQPSKRDLPEDFRRKYGASSPLTKKTLLAIRKAQNLQEISNELMENLGQDEDIDAIGADLEDDPEKKARVERDRTEITLKQQKEVWKNEYQAFRGWRDYIELRNALIFQFPMELSELRGLTLMTMKPFAVVLNSSDSPQARIFTLFHEFGHILLHKPALCTPEEPIVRKKLGREIEYWCNRFAAAYLLPAESVKKDFDKFGVSEFRRMAEIYKVSYSAMLRRLKDLELITKGEYEHEMNELKRGVIGQQQTGGGETLAKKARRERGDTFISLVLENSEKGYITHSDALDYLDVKLKDLRGLTSPMP